MDSMTPLSVDRHPLPALLLAALALLAWLGLAGCSDPDQAPAQQAIGQIERALADAGPDPAKYIPGDLRDVQDRLAVLKQAYERDQFDVVVRDAPAVLAAARGLGTDAARRRDEFAQAMQAEWHALETAMPAEITAMRSLLQDVTARGQRPPGLTDDRLARAHQRAEDSQALWERAVEESKAGHLPEAVTLASQARTLAAEATAALDPAAAPPATK